MTQSNSMAVTALAGATLTCVEVIQILRIDRNSLCEMVEVGLVEPINRTHIVDVDNWRFSSDDLRRLRVAARIINDLDVNLTGAALVMDLLEERDALRKQVELLRSYLNT